MSTIFRECSKRAYRPSGSWRYGQIPKHPNTGNLKPGVQIASAVEGESSFGRFCSPPLPMLNPTLKPISNWSASDKSYVELHKSTASEPGKGTIPGTYMLAWLYNVNNHKIETS